MILINVKWHIKPEFADEWPSICAAFTAATKAEEGNVFFEWSRSIENSTDYYLVECFRDADAGATHVTSEHFATATAAFGKYIRTENQIIYVDSDIVRGWGPMSEIKPE